MMKNAFVLFTAITCFACSCRLHPDAPPSVKNDSPGTTTVNTDSLNGCYEMIIEKDTAFMQLKQAGNVVSGPLVYKRFQKDSNSGNLNLEMHNGRASGWYTFQSEGKTTVRQIILHASGDSLEEAYGDIEMKADSAYYKYPASLKFEDRHPFKKIACD